jgi:hypothetical protein
MSMPDSLASLVLSDTALTFRRLKELTERALAQIGDEEFFRTIDAESNSIAILVRHIGGNLRSRWTNFLTEDGEKSWRDRDGEFVVAPGTKRADVMAEWDAGWRALFDAFASLSPDQLTATVRLRGESMPAIAAIHRGVAHIAQHVGQIVLLAKHYRAAEWQTLSIPRARPRDATPGGPPSPGGA